MERFGVRELRQNASKLLERVAAGESLEITIHGRPVARLVPVVDVFHPRSSQALIEAGLMTEGHGDLLRTDPLPAPAEGPTASEILADSRSERLA